jgi:hypothetical protein
MSIYKRTIIIAIAVVMMLGVISPALAGSETWTPFLPRQGTIEYDDKTYGWTLSLGHTTFELSVTPSGYDEVTEFEWYLEFRNMAPPYDIISITGTTLTGLKETGMVGNKEGGYGLTGDDNMGRWSGVDKRGVVFYGRWTTLPDGPPKFFDYSNVAPARVHGWWILDGSSDGKACPTQIRFDGYWW